MKKAAKNFTRFSLLICVTSLIYSSSFANDSIGSVAAGGITFLKSEDIRLTSEDLRIAPDTINIRYKFFNESNKDIYATIAFPMPPYGWNSGEFAGMFNERPLNSFIVKIDGREIDAKRNKRAMVSNTDVTGTLRKIGLNDEQIFKTFATCINENEDIEYYCGVSKLQEDKLKKLGSWKVAETAIWEQNFPAKKVIEVQHEYVPFLGQYFIYAYQQKEFNYSAFEQITDACLDASTTNALKKRVQTQVRSGAKTVRIKVGRVEYILGTGRNWKGPINDFKLRILKDSPDQLISLCFPGKPMRINSKAIEFKQNNYIPQDSVTVYFFQVES